MHAQLDFKSKGEMNITIWENKTMSFVKLEQQAI